jgi:hypothetical protein
MSDADLFSNCLTRRVRRSFGAKSPTQCLWNSTARRQTSTARRS